MNHLSKKVCYSREAFENKENGTSSGVRMDGSSSDVSKGLPNSTSDCEVTAMKQPQLRVLNLRSNIPHDNQTDDLSIPVDSIFVDGFPEGRIDYYVDLDERKRISTEEERLSKLDLHEAETSLRKAAEVHREARSYIQSKIRPGKRYWDICCDIEDKIRFLIGENGPNAGVGFPTGVSPNHISAHYTPNPGDSTVLQYGDVVKFDFGTQVNGYIIDCAFTVAFDPQFDELLKASKDATYTGVKNSGLGVRLGELGGIIEEVINSYEVEIYGRTYPSSPRVKGIMRHTLVKGSIHGSKGIPLVYEDSSEIMEEGDIFALETFATTGKGVASPVSMTSHYALNDMSEYPVMAPREEALLKHIKRTFNTLPFCRRWLDRADGGSFAVNGNNGRQVKYMDALQELVSKGIVEDYPPLCDIQGSYSSQWEHTFLIKENCKEVFSVGNDY